MEGSSYFLRADRETGSAGLFLSFLSPCHGGSFLENALCFLSFLSPCHWGYMCRKHCGQWVSRLFTREISPLIDDAISRLGTGAVCQWHTIKAPTGAERRPLCGAAYVQT